MMVLYPFAAREGFQPLRRAQAFVWTRLAAFNCDVAGLRWMIVALAVRSLGSCLRLWRSGNWAGWPGMYCGGLARRPFCGRVASC